MLGEVAHPGKQPHWQNAKVSAVREELPAGTAFQAALGVLAGCSIQIIPAFTVGLLWITVLYPGESANSPRDTFWGNELLSA